MIPVVLACWKDSWDQDLDSGFATGSVDIFG